MWSCETQLMVTARDIVKNLAQGYQVDLVSLDFSKAFDRVPHRKLHCYIVRNNTLSWIQVFLTSKSQQVVLEGAHSSLAPALSGIPQGTVLGPLLFVAYINDLPDAVKSSNVRLFTDDSLLYRKICNQELLQQDLQYFEGWENTWQMSFNPSKCNTIKFNQANKRAYSQQPTISMDNN